MIELFIDEGGQWRYRIKGRNGEIMVTSEGYASEGNARRGVDDLRDLWADPEPFKIVVVR